MYDGAASDALESARACAQRRPWREPAHRRFPRPQCMKWRPQSTSARIPPQWSVFRWVRPPRLRPCAWRNWPRSWRAPASSVRPGRPQSVPRLTRQATALRCAAQRWSSTGDMLAPRAATPGSARPSSPALTTPWGLHPRFAPTTAMTSSGAPPTGAPAPAQTSWEPRPASLPPCAPLASETRLCAERVRTPRTPIRSPAQPMGRRARRPMACC